MSCQPADHCHPTSTRSYEESTVPAPQSVRKMSQTPASYTHEQASDLSVQNTSDQPPSYTQQWASDLCNVAFVRPFKGRLIRNHRQVHQFEQNQGRMEQSLQSSLTLMHQHCTCSEACRLLDRLATGRTEGDDLIVDLWSEGLLRKWAAQIETKAYYDGWAAGRSAGHLEGRDAVRQDLRRSLNQSQRKPFRSPTERGNEDSANDKEDTLRSCDGGCFLHLPQKSGRCPVCYLRKRMYSILPGQVANEQSAMKSRPSMDSGCRRTRL